MEGERKSPPKHRHDGTSPLPLGMDWSPPPRKWNGRDSVWPHDPRTGWSYCIIIPSWVVVPKTRDSDPVVFYRVQVGVQSPEGVTTSRPVLRRFNDFLKLHAALRKAFPRKSLPPPPPKGLLRLKSRTLLEERRRSLEEWMAKLLSDIDISRSFVVASFLELEVAARLSFQNDNQQTAQANLTGNNSSLQVYANSSQALVAGTSSFTSDYGSDTAYETSEIGTSSLGRDNNSEIGIEDLSLEEDLTGPIEKLVKYGMSNIDEGLFMGHAILEQLEGFPRHTVQSREINKVIESCTDNGNASSTAYPSGHSMEFLSQPGFGKAIGHSRKLSNESIGSETSSIRGSDLSNSGYPNSFVDGALGLARDSEVSRSVDSLGNELQDDVKLVLQSDQQLKINRALVSMQRRLVTAKTDMEDLLSRLNKEIAVNDYLTTKVKDLEEELETTKRKSRENLQQAIELERERFTQMQWDMEELKQKSLEMEFKLKSQQVEKPDETGSVAVSTVEANDTLLQELDMTKKQLADLLKKHQELEMKSKADVKVLVKEVKSLRSSQVELKQQLSQSLMGKSEAEKLLQQERQKFENQQVARKKLLHECEVLHNRLRECSINSLNETEGKLLLDSTALQNIGDFLAISDDRIELLLAEAKIMAQADDLDIPKVKEISNTDDSMAVEIELRKKMSEILVDNIELRKQVSSVIGYGLKMRIPFQRNNDEALSENNVGNNV